MSPLCFHRHKKNPTDKIRKGFASDPGWVRTNDLRLKRALLYQLSYGVCIFSSEA